MITTVNSLDVGFRAVVLGFPLNWYCPKADEKCDIVSTFVASQIHFSPFQTVKNVMRSGLSIGERREVDANSCPDGSG